jgi:threonyl-tRNA synthetase
MSISVILPDGAKRELDDGATALDLARAISPGLAERVVVARVNGKTADIQAPLHDGAKVELLKADTPEGIDALRHSTEHILATAVVRLFDGAQVTMGPKTHETEFYYDFDIGRPFTPEDLEKIAAEMQSLIKAKTPFVRETLSKADARKLFKELGQRFKDEILDWIPDDSVSIYRSGPFIDLCRGPHLPHAGHIGAFALNGASGAYWRADASREMLQRVSGIAFPTKKMLDEHLFRIEEAKKRDHRKLGRELDLFVVSEKYEKKSYEKEKEIELFVEGEYGAGLSSFRDEGTAELICAVATRFVRANRQDKSVDVRLTGDAFRASAALEPNVVKIKLRVSGPIDAMPVALVAASRGDKASQATIGEYFASAVRRVTDKDDDAAVSESFKPWIDFQAECQVIEIHGSFLEEIGPGLVLWLPKGGRVRTLLEEQWRRMHFDGGYEIVYSPHLAKTDLWKVSGHWSFYRDGMFSPMSIDGHEYVMKPMNCPFHIMMFKSRARSYRELPFRWAELGTVYRYEMAGVLHGLMRVRGFTQDDAHIFCRWDQLDSEVDRVLKFILKVLRTFGFNEFELNLSTRPEKFVGETDEWTKAEASLEAAIKREGLPYVVDEGGGAFYGPKIDVKLKDCLGRMWQCSTLQLDFNNPARFELEFTNREGKPERPVMLHRALLGSIERFTGILIEQYAGAFPMWLAPEQVRVLPIADRHLDHSLEVARALTAKGFRVSTSETNEKLGARVRQAQLDKIPVMLVVGDKEVADGGATVRMRDGSDRGILSLEGLIGALEAEAAIPEG